MMQPKLTGWVTAAAMLFSVFAAGILGGLAVSELRSPEPELRGGRGPGGQDGRGFGGGPGGFGDGRQGGGRGGPDRGPGRGGPGGPGGMSGRVPLLPPGVLDRLSLTEAQRASVDEIIQRRNGLTEAMLREVYPKLRTQVDSANIEIRALLTPDQQAEFDRLREEMRFPQGGGRGRPRGERDGPPPGGS
jgi:hypothetical protein